MDNYLSPIWHLEWLFISDVALRMIIYYQYGIKRMIITDTALRMIIYH